jgi:hypothetical protein
VVPHPQIRLLAGNRLAEQQMGPPAVLVGRAVVDGRAHQRVPEPYRASGKLNQASPFGISGCGVHVDAALLRGAPQHRALVVDAGRGEQQERPRVRIQGAHLPAEAIH